jgi:L-threonylcarbamoyladenylate synthase
VERIVLDPSAVGADVAKAAAVLAALGIVVYPTDTFYGLAVDPRNEAAVEKLFAAKGRDFRQPSPLIAADTAQAEEAVEFNDAGRLLAARFWPGPLSLVLPARAQIHRRVLGGGMTAAVRVPAHSVAQALAHAFGSCITATSANLSGEPPVRSAADLSPSLIEQIDMLIDGGETPGEAPSTIVDLTEPVPRLVRAGAVPWKRVLESLK